MSLFSTAMIAYHVTYHRSSVLGFVAVQYRAALCWVARSLSRLNFHIMTSTASQKEPGSHCSCTLEFGKSLCSCHGTNDIH